MADLPTSTVTFLFTKAMSLEETAEYALREGDDCALPNDLSG
jgi:hypothetical protein